MRSARLIHRAAFVIEAEESAASGGDMQVEIVMNRRQVKLSGLPGSASRAGCNGAKLIFAHFGEERIAQMIAYAEN